MDEIEIDGEINLQGSHTDAADQVEFASDLPYKRRKCSSSESMEQMLANLQQTMLSRFDAMDAKMDMLVNRTHYLEDKLDDLCAVLLGDTPIRTDEPATQAAMKKTSIVGMTQSKTDSSGPVVVCPSSTQNMTLISLNTEDDYPNGVWLGDENNTEMRVRVPLSHADLLHINVNCRTPEKMALTLLDYLFDRDTQAISNLSGQGRHGKRQLDPLLIYGIRCHLIHHFGLMEPDWRKIKQNIDSKCRTAFRRKLRGLPLAVKAFRAKADGSEGGEGEGELHHPADDSPSPAPPEIVWCEQELGSCGSEDDALQQLTDDTHLAIHGADVDFVGAPTSTVLLSSVSTDLFTTATQQRLHAPSKMAVKHTQQSHQPVLQQRTLNRQASGGGMLSNVHVIKIVQSADGTIEVRDNMGDHESVIAAAAASYH